MGKKRLLKTGLFALVLSAALIATPAYAVTPSPATKVSRVTGATPTGETLPNPNHTDTNYQVMGTDLGIMWDNGQGQIMAAFGDTYGQGWTGPGAGGGDWRSNVLGISTNTDPVNGLKFSTMIQDTPGHAKELLSSLKIDNNEITVIPTAGVTVGTRSYIHYMSVNHWGATGGTWVTNYSGIAYSDDNGQNWTKDPNTQWSSTSNFAEAAFVRTGGYVYMFGTPSGRFGNLYLARVPEANMLSLASYQYWDGNNWQTNNEAAAVPIVNAPVGELSVQYNSYFGRYLMTYLDENRAALVLRDSASLTGPWTGEKILARGSTYPKLYGAFIHPWFNSGTDLYFNMAQWDPYNVFFMHSTLSADSLGDNMVSDPGFEDQTTSSVSAPWRVEGTGGIDLSLGNAHSGSNNAWLRSTTGWNAVKQTIAVAPNHNYRLTGWVRTSSNQNNGYFGVRAVNNGPVVQETQFGSLPGYTQLTVNFNSGNNSLVDIYGGFWAPGTDAWVQLDDFSVTPVTSGELVTDPGFENQTGNTVSNPWITDGPDSMGIDTGLGYAHTGANNAWIHPTALSTNWNAIKQVIPVTPNTNYTLRGWIINSNNFTGGYFGVRGSNGAIINETNYGGLSTYTQLSVPFNSGNNTTATIYAGYWAPGVDSWIRVDDVSVQ